MNRIEPESPVAPQPLEAEPPPSPTLGEAEHAGRANAVRFGAWLSRPVGRSVPLGIAAIILCAPAWLLSDQIVPFILFNDDFAFIVESRDWPTTRAHLLLPHEAHVVPLFRLWSFALVSLAGNLANLPLVLGMASYFGLLVTMLLVRHLVARETQQTSVGLAAMAGVGMTTVIEPGIRWYSAGQALWAAAAIVFAVILARNWCLKGGTLRLVLATLSCFAAPAVWTGGIVACPAAISYLWAKRSCRSRGLALALAAAAAAFVIVFLLLTWRDIFRNKVVWEKHDELWPRPIQAVLHTAQGITETLFFANLGVDAIVTPSQAVWISLVLAGIWFWSRGGCRRLHPLEAAGAATVLGSYLVIFTFRGNHPYVSVRPAGWYHLIAHVGLVLFVSGWWVQLRRRDAGTASNALPSGLPHPGRLTRLEAIAVLALVYVLGSVQSPRAVALIVRWAPPRIKFEQVLFPDSSLQRWRARYLRIQFHQMQVRALARAEEARPIAIRLGAGPTALRRAFGQVLVPGTFAGQVTCDMVGLMNLPPDDPNARPDPARLRSALGALLRVEPEPRPVWLRPGDPWPPPT